MCKSKKLKKPISEELSLILKEILTDHDMANVSLEKNVGLSTIQKVVARKGTITEYNYPAIEKLIEIARDTCSKKIGDLIADTNATIKTNTEKIKEYKDLSQTLMQW